jgi:serine/threonine protein kinase
MPQPGESLGGYSLLELLKAGRGVAVYKAVDKVSDALVAVKALFGEALEDPAAVSAFELEGRAMTQIAHRNVCPAGTGARPKGSASSFRSG